MLNQGDRVSKGTHHEIQGRLAVAKGEGLKLKKFEIMDEWVLKGVSGDKAAKEILLVTFKPLILSMVQKYVYTVGSKEDAFQEGCVVFLESLAQFDHTRGVPFPGYIKQCLFYYFLRFPKREAVKETLSFDESMESGFLPEALKDLRNAPERVFCEAEDKRLSRDALGQKLRALQVNQREAIIDYYLLGMSVSRIAKAKGIKNDLVRKRIERGIKAMK